MKKAKLTMACVYLLTVSVCVNAYAAETAESVIYVEKTAVSETDEIFESPAEEEVKSAELPTEDNTDETQSITEGSEAKNSEFQAENNDEARNASIMDQSVIEMSDNSETGENDEKTENIRVFLSEPPAEEEISFAYKAEYIPHESGNNRRDYISEPPAESGGDEIFESPAHFGTAEPPAEYEKNQSEAPAEDNDEAMNTPTIETPAPSESISVTHVPADSDGTKWWVFFSEPPAEYEKNQSEAPAEDSDVATRIISAENTNPSDGVTDGESDADAVTDGKSDADAVADGKSESNVNNEVQSGKVVAPKTGDAASSKTRLFVLAAMLGIAVVIACRSNRYVMKNE